MSSPPRTPNAPQPYPMRPHAAWTSDSVFADSAISIEPTTGTSHSEIPKTVDSPPESHGCSLSERLNQLAAAAWAAEQDGSLSLARDDKLRKALSVIQARLGDNNEVDSDISEVGSQISQCLSQSQIEPAAGPDQAQLQKIQDSLAFTVASMRLRQQEQRHLHRLSIQKMEAVAQTCLVQKKQLGDRAHEVQILRGENQKLGEDNDCLRDHIAELESETKKRDMAVNAMSSAVAGLEGWINNSPEPNRLLTPPARSRATQRNTVVRGRGRFRGKYRVEEDHTNGLDYGMDGALDTRDLQDGVKAWLRGFRDVEEELQKSSPSRSIQSKEGRHDFASEDEWGESVIVTDT